MSERKMPLYHTVEGMTFGQLFSAECVREALKYKPRADDVFIVTYPKCGTTWTQTMVLHIYTKGVPMKNQQEFFSLCPFLEMAGADAAVNMPRPGAIKTHLPFQLQPYSPEAKYVYVARNPKDCCVSFYHHTQSIPGYNFEDGTFDDFFELFINGEADYGDYFDHILSWYEHRDDPNVLFLTYEEMKKDTRGAILKMAKFIGKEYSDLIEEDTEVMDNILHYSSFKYMKEHFGNALKMMDGHLTEEAIRNLPLPKGVKYLIKFTSELNLPDKPRDIKFIRKGIVGDWRSHFSEEQSKRIDERFAEKLGHTYLAKLWEDDMKFH